MSKYDDIIDLPHHRSDKYPHMSNYDRAAQFSPFAALTGYDDAIEETARVTDVKVELSEDTIAKLDAELAHIAARLPEKPQVTVTYFKADEKKAGGRYLVYTGAVKKIDAVNRTIIFYGGREFAFNNILWLDEDQDG